MIVTVAEAVAFYNHWPFNEDWDVEDCGLTISRGKATGAEGCGLTDDVMLIEAVGMIVWIGDGQPPTSVDINGQSVGVTMYGDVDVDDAFIAWKGDAAVVFLMVEGHKMEALQAFCREHDIRGVDDGSED